MTSSDREEWFDPRLTVFVIWGIFVILFVCIPSKRLVQRIFRAIGCSCCGYEEEVALGTNNGSHDVSYEILSNARKQEIDSLRASHLTFRVHPFTLTLETKHMLSRKSSADTPNLSQIASLPQDKKSDQKNNCSVIDSGAGIVEGMDMPEPDEESPEEIVVDGPERDEEEGGRESKGGLNEEKRVDEKGREEADGSEYTHISIPLPGHNFDGVDVNIPEVCKEEGKKPDKEEKKPGSKIRLFRRKSKEWGKEANNDNNNSKKEEEELKTVGEGPSQDKGKRRTCSIFCAVCLMEYEPSDRVTWSSNPECTHVFHEDCLVNWLVSLGRTKSKMQRFPEDPTEAQLLNYGLECPCCRQEFISRGAAELPEVCGMEENV